MRHSARFICVFAVLAGVGCAGGSEPASTGVTTAPKSRGSALVIEAHLVVEEHSKDSNTSVTDYVLHGDELEEHRKYSGHGGPDESRKSASLSDADLAALVARVHALGLDRSTKLELKTGGAGTRHTLSLEIDIGGTRSEIVVDGMTHVYGEAPVELLADQPLYTSTGLLLADLQALVAGTWKPPPATTAKPAAPVTAASGAGPDDEIACTADADCRRTTLEAETCCTRCESRALNAKGLERLNALCKDKSGGPPRCPSLDCERDPNEPKCVAGRCAMVPR